MSNPIKVIKLTGVSGSLEGKADIDHDHTLSDITDAGSAAAANTGDFATAAQGVAADNSIQKGTLASVNADISDATLIDTTDPRLSDARTPTTHDHTLSDITDAGTSAGLDVAVTGDANASEVVKGNDSRLSDTRDPNAHSHVESDISNLGTDVVLKSQVDISAASWVVDEDNLGSNSDTVVPTQASVKAYVDNTVGSPLTGAEIKTAYEGELDTNAFTDAEKTKLAGIDTGATDDQTGAEIKLAYEAEANTNAFTDAEQTKLAGIEDAATADQTGAEIKLAYEGELDTNAFTDAEKTKLAGIDTGATDDQTGAEIKLAYESEANTNAFTDAEQTKLAGIDTGATDDQTGAEIKALYEAEPNAFTDSLKAKLDSIDFGAKDDQTGAEIKALYEAEPSAFTDALYTKLNAIEANAKDDQTGAEIKALYEAEPNAFTDALKTKLDAIESNATADQTGAEIKALYASEPNAFTDTLYTKLDNIETNATADQTGAEIKALYEAEPNAFTDALYTKLNNLDAASFKGDYDASLNAPDLEFPSAGEVFQGDIYRVSVAGTFFTQPLVAGDFIIALVDDANALSEYGILQHANASLVETGTAAPTAAPSNAGDIFVDTTNNVVYIAFATTASTDWKQIGSSDLLVETGTAAPTTTPTSEGDLFIDTTNDIAYVAVGTASAADWFEVGSGGGATQLSELSDVNTSTPTNRNVLVADGVDWESRALVEADISDLGSYITASSTDTLTNKTFDANGTGNSISNIDVADLSATGTPSSTTYLRGDNTWASVASGGGMVTGISKNSGANVNAANRSVLNFIEGTGITLTIADDAAGDEVDITIDAAGGGGGGTVQGTHSTYDIKAANEGVTTGNARGNYSVDLQTFRNAATQVASGTGSVLIGGSTNTASATYSMVLGGNSNTISASFGTGSSIVGGTNNTVSGSFDTTYAAILGGASNTVSVYNSAIIAGSQNTVSGGMGGNNSVIVGGNSNTCDYSNNCVILGGINNEIGDPLQPSWYSYGCIVGGNRVKITNGANGVFAFADSTAADFTVSLSNSAQFRVANGLHSTGPLFLTERASALTDIAGKGQLWVKTATPNELWFTDDAGNDTPITGATYGMLYNNANATPTVCNTTPAAVDWVSAGSSSGTTPSTTSNIITLPTAGTYRVEANICCTTDTAGEYQFEIYHYNGTGWSGTGFVADRAMPNNGDVGSATVSGVINIAATSPASAVAVYQSVDAGSTSNFIVQSGQLVVTKL